MARLLELIRRSALPSHQMMTAAKGALDTPAGEMVEILVYLAENNKIFGEQSRITLAGWDEKSEKQLHPIRLLRKRYSITGFLERTSGRLCFRFFLRTLPYHLEKLARLPAPQKVSGLM